MRRHQLRAACPPLLLAGALVCFTAVVALAQESAPAESKRARTAAEKIDEYGRLGHCDLTARLDNLALELQNSPTEKAYIISYDELEKKSRNRNIADWQLKQARYYLTEERGIDASRVVVINAGSKDVEGGLTELWLVPEGAVPPATPSESSETDKFTTRDFSGRFDVYSTDENIYREMVEMGWTSSGIAHTQFARKLKQQPESVGYLVVRTSQDSLPGTWRRIARRDEYILSKDYEIEADRLKSIDGGPSAGGGAEVELWILPKSAPPPVAAGKIEKTGKKPDAAYKLNAYESYGSTDEDAERWVIENLAEILRDDPHAAGYLIVREPAEQIATDEEEPASDAAEGTTPVAEQLPPVAGAAAEDDAAASVPETGEVESSMKEVAERWKKTLSEKYGIEARRVVILEGRRMGWSSGRLTTWVVPEKAPTPDPFSRDADEQEEETEESAADAEPAPPAPPFER